MSFEMEEGEDELAPVVKKVKANPKLVSVGQEEPEKLVDTKMPEAPVEEQRKFWQKRKTSPETEDEADEIGATLPIQKPTADVESDDDQPAELAKPSALERTNAEIAALKALTKHAREGSLPDVGCGRYSKVVHLGHSFGSVITYALANESPELTDAIVLTGFTQACGGLAAERWQSTPSRVIIERVRAAPPVVVTLGKDSGVSFFGTKRGTTLSSHPPLSPCFEGSRSHRAPTSLLGCGVTLLPALSRVLLRAFRSSRPFKGGLAGLSLQMCARARRR